MGSEGMERTGTSCEAIAEGDGALESWEMVDLEASMKKLLASSPALCCRAVERGQGTAQLSSRAQISSVPDATSESAMCEALPELIDSEDVDSFLRDALQGKDRLTILRLEQEVERFMRNPKMQQLEFQPMPSSYLRLVAHRVVQHYNLQSSVADSSTPDGTRIIARKTSDTRLPTVRLADIPISTHSEENQVISTQQRFELKRRPNKSMKAGREANGSLDPSSKSNASKSVEERKEEYNRARARIFNNGELVVKADGESFGLEGTQVGTQVALDLLSNNTFRLDKKSEPTTDSVARVEIFNGPPKFGFMKQERDVTAPMKNNGRVAIFRDREKDRKDPDYDRNYDRYMQRFDPGFGVSQANPYGIQAVYSPVVNYNTEFPQLGGQIRSQVCVDPPGARTTPPSLRGPWAGSSSGMTYGHPDSMMGSFNPGHLTSQSAGVYVHSQQYPQPGATMAYVHLQDRFPQSMSQSHLQSEGSFSQARRQ